MEWWHRTPVLRCLVPCASWAHHTTVPDKCLQMKDALAQHSGLIVDNFFLLFLFIFNITACTGDTVKVWQLKHFSQSVIDRLIHKEQFKQI